MTSDFALSEASGRLAYSRSSCHPASQLSSVQLVRSNRQILNKSKSRLERSIVRSCCLGSAQGRAIKTNTSMCHGQRGAHQEAANASSTCGTWDIARQKPGRVVVRHFCDWLLCPNVQTSPRHLSLQKALLWGTVMVRRRGKLQESLDAAKLVTRPMRVNLRGSASQLLSSIEVVGGDRRFWLKPARTLLAWSSQLLRGRSGEPGWKRWDSR
jgi:hypothetical protein